MFLFIVVFDKERTNVSHGNFFRFFPQQKFQFWIRFQILLKFVNIPVPVGHALRWKFVGWLNGWQHS